MFWIAVAILIYGWFNDAQLVNEGFDWSEEIVKYLAGLDQSGRTETIIVDILHLGDFLLIGAIMLVVSLVLMVIRNLMFRSGVHQTLAGTVANLVVLLVLAYIVLVVVWWYDAPLVNAWFDFSRALVSSVAELIDPDRQLELVLRTLGIPRHLVVASVMLVLGLAWEIVKGIFRGLGVA